MVGYLRHRQMPLAVEAYLDGELPPPGDAEVARHLSICWNCSTVAETLRLIKQSLTHRRDPATPLLTERRLRCWAEGLTVHRSSAGGGS